MLDLFIIERFYVTQSQVFKRWWFFSKTGKKGNFSEHHNSTGNEVIDFIFCRRDAHIGSPNICESECN